MKTTILPVNLADGTAAILKIGVPHVEAEHEIDGMRFWNGDPTAHLYWADRNSYSLLLERCEPGTPLSELPEPEQDVIIAGLLCRLWRMPPDPHPFRPLAAMLAHWGNESRRQADRWPDTGLVREGLRLFDELPQTASTQALLATDLHAGNVLRAEREPWLVIDPKPFIGDPAYDATQHLLNCEQRLLDDPADAIHRFADLLQLDTERVRLWLFARAAAEPRDDLAGWEVQLARKIAP